MKSWWVWQAHFNPLQKKKKKNKTWVGSSSYKRYSGYSPHPWHRSEGTEQGRGLGTVTYPLCVFSSKMLRLALAGGPRRKVLSAPAL
jgi:hypothetical protein